MILNSQKQLFIYLISNGINYLQTAYPSHIRFRLGVAQARLLSSEHATEPIFLLSRLAKPQWLNSVKIFGNSDILCVRSLRYSTKILPVEMGKKQINIAFCNYSQTCHPCRNNFYQHRFSMIVMQIKSLSKLFILLIT